MKSLDIIQTQIAILSVQLDTQEPNENNIEKQLEDLKIVEEDLKKLRTLKKVLYFKEKENCFELHTTRSRLFKKNNAMTKEQKKDQKRLEKIKKWLDEVKND